MCVVCVSRLLGNQLRNYVFAGGIHDKIYQPSKNQYSSNLLWTGITRRRWRVATKCIKLTTPCALALSSLHLVFLITAWRRVQQLVYWNIPVQSNATRTRLVPRVCIREADNDRRDERRKHEVSAWIISADLIFSFIFFAMPRTRTTTCVFIVECQIDRSISASCVLYRRRL